MDTILCSLYSHMDIQLLQVSWPTYIDHENFTTKRQGCFIFAGQNNYWLYLALVGASAFWITKRLGSRQQGWKPAYIKSSFLRLILATLFIGLNILILVEGAQLHTTGEIPRYWWPAISRFIVTASFAYWCGLRVLMLPNPFASGLGVKPRNDNARGVGSSEELPEETISQALFRVNINIVYEDSSEYYRDDAEYSTLCFIDGSRRRILYTVCWKPNLFVLDNGWYCSLSRLMTGRWSWIVRYCRCLVQDDWWFFRELFPTSDNMQFLSLVCPPMTISVLCENATHEVPRRSWYNYILHWVWLHLSWSRFVRNDCYVY